MADMPQRAKPTEKFNFPDYTGPRINLALGNGHRMENERCGN